MMARIATLILLACILFGVACSDNDPNGNASGVSDVETRAGSDTAATVIDAFELLQFSTFVEAEAMARFRIPRPSPPFALANGTTTLRPRKGGGYVSTTQYAHPSLSPNSMGLAAAARGELDLELFAGLPTEALGGRNVRVHKGASGGREIHFQCGDGDSLDCIVRAGRAFNDDVVAEFVASVH
jgi:hypothetical protein